MPHLWLSRHGFNLVTHKNYQSYVYGQGEDDVHSIPCYVHSGCFKHIGKFTHHYTLFYMCMSTKLSFAGTRLLLHTEVLLARFHWYNRSLCSYFCISIHFIFAMRQMLGLTFTTCVLCPGYYQSISLYVCVDHTILFTPTVLATTRLLLFTDRLSCFTFRYYFQLPNDRKW